MNRTRQIRWLPLGLGVFIGVFVLAAVATLFRDDAAPPNDDIAGLDGACRRNVSSACGRRLRLDEALAGGGGACLACVWETCGELYGHAAALWPPAARDRARHQRARECVPIEPLRRAEWRHDARGGDHDHELTGDDADPRANGALAAAVAAKAALLGGDAVAARRRRVYVDLGANRYESSIGNWFRRTYPRAETFDVVAFEAEDVYDETYADAPDVELHHYAVWTRNESVPWGHMAKKTGTLRSGFVLPRRLRSAHALVADAARPTRPGIDIADFLKRRFREDDFLVVKMDLEGAEYAIVPHLIAEGVGPLIDELFIEVHTETNTCCKPPRDAGRHRADALRLIQRLRDAGVYAHEWL